MKLNHIWTSAPGLVWTGWRRRSMIGPQNSTSSRFNANVFEKNISNPTPNYFAVCGRTWRGTTRGGEGGGGHNQPADAPLVKQVSSVVALNPYISSIPLSLKDLVGRCPWTSSRWWSRTEEATRWSATAPASRTRLSQTWSSSENTSSKRNKPKNTFGNILIS